MRSWIISVIAVLSRISVGIANDQGLLLVTSSEFKMDLAPTYERLDIAAVSKVELAIKSILWLASSGSSSFRNVFDVDIVLQKIEWGLLVEEQETPSTTLQFEVHMAFFKDASTLPSKFSLDSLIVRTFSQPSTKGTFLTTLDLSKDEKLARIESVEIEQPEEASNEPEPSTKSSRSMSDLDIVLITSSVFMFLGVVYVICQYHKDKTKYEAQQTRNYAEWTQRVRRSRSRLPRANYTNPDLNESRVTSDAESAWETESTVEGTLKASATTSPERLLDDGVSTTGGDSEVRPTPPISPCSSFPKSPAENIDYVNVSQVASRSKASTTNSSLNAENLEALETENPARQARTSKNRLAMRLSNLPLMNPSRRMKKHPSLTSASTQEDYIKSLSDFSLSKESSVGEMSSIFKLSTDDLSAYTGDMSSTFKVILPEHRQPHESAAASVSSRSAASSEKTRLRDNRCFENNWSESKKKALEVDDDSSTADLFHVDVEAYNSAEESSSKGSGASTVSEWMKSLRVVRSWSSSVTEERSSFGAKSQNILENTDSVASNETSVAALTAPIQPFG